MRAGRYCTLVVLALLAGQIPLSAQPQGATSPSRSNFTVFVRGVPVGTEQVSVTQTSTGWTVSGNGRLGAPLDVTTALFEARYDAEWKPREVTLDSTLRGQAVQVKTMVSGTSIRSQITEAGTPREKQDDVPADPVMLWTYFFGSYEALAGRLGPHVTAPAEIAAYFVAQSPTTIQVKETRTEQIQTAKRVIAARRVLFSFKDPSGSVDAQIWIDETGRLIRFQLPSQNIEVAREDISTVASRTQLLPRSNDESVRIAANGFNLAATISKPMTAGIAKLPAVILVAGPGATDREQITAGVPVFGQLAAGLADAGFLIVRYDLRGVGQSGGRPEAAALADYAEDVRAIVRYLDRRKDTDHKSIGVVGYAEGGPVAMLAAAREQRIARVALVASPGTTGAEVTLEQQKRLLSRMNVSEAERQSKIDLQQKIHHAVISGSGWEDVPAPIRRQSETPWFRAFLAFDPAQTIAEVKQPMLIVGGALDRQVPSSHAERLGELAKARKDRKAGPAEVVIVPGINHLLVAATTGEVDEYPSLPDLTVSREVVWALSGWLANTLKPSAR